MEPTDALIQSFLDGALSEEDTQAIRDRIQTDPDFAQQVEEVRQLRGLLGTYQADLQLREVIRDLYQESAGISGEEHSAEVRPLFQKRWIYAGLIAASLALLFWLLGRQTQPTAASSQELLATYYSPAPAPERMAMDTAEAQQALVNGHEAYRKGNYAVAIENYQQAATDSKLQAEADFYQAQALLATQDYGRAEALLKQIPNRQGEVRWYLALAAIGMEDWALAEERLQNISKQPGADFQKEVEEMLKHFPR